MLKRLHGRPRRILMTVDAVGGVWQYAVGLAEQLASSGDAVVLAGMGPPPTNEQKRHAEAFATVTWLETPPDWMAADERELNTLSADLRRLVREHAADLVHLNAPAQAANLSLPCPVVVVSHSCVVTWFREVRGGPPKGRWSWHVDCNRLGLARADMVLAPSESHAAALRACYGAVPRLTVVHNAVPTNARQTKRENIIFAAARWWDEGKNGPVLDAAASKTAWPIFAAGPTAGPNSECLGFRHVISLGSISNTETRHLMARASVFVSPSLYEPFGLAALEAATAGTPLILADIPTYRELWADAALFFPPHNPDALADAVDHLARNASDRRKFGAAALRRSRLYTMARQAAETRAAYDKAALHAQRH
jgi:glycosyltransferase involved in cell wall biosynthesis